MGNCKDCRHWGEKQWGFVMRNCQMAGTNDSLFFAARGEAIRTSPEFGCVQFEMNIRNDSPELSTDHIAKNYGGISRSPFGSRKP